MYTISLKTTLSSSYTLSTNAQCTSGAHRFLRCPIRQPGVLRVQLGASFVHPAIKAHRAPLTRALKQGIVIAGEVEDLPEPLRKIVMAFQMVPDPMARYKQLLFYAAKLKALPQEYQTPENKVPGCVSQVWVVPTLEDGKVYFTAESDSQLTKGLAALLVEGLSGCSPQEVLSVKPDFIEMLGLSQSLTPSRNNGFLNMLLTMQKKTIAAFMEQEKANKEDASTREDAAGEGEETLQAGESEV
ncbi:hypothetical protein CYMTET_39277 [Cymbomonas tetramitiformis]|uniref:Fe-S metabolism associated domain-containing protein n=1 Tax=Cymbomonas tetramitiformis TaxID=36881 RepID=A0AAE0CCM3_9CHLO|nr:hypothetical protein CYMTET_39277 [Cymbomonas tetramitiformis]